MPGNTYCHDSELTLYSGETSSKSHPAPRGCGVTFRRWPEIEMKQRKWTHVISVEDDHLPRPLPGLCHPAPDDAQIPSWICHITDATLPGQRPLRRGRGRCGGRRGWGYGRDVVWRTALLYVMSDKVCMCNYIRITNTHTHTHTHTHTLQTIFLILYSLNYLSFFYVFLSLFGFLPYTTSQPTSASWRTSVPNMWVFRSLPQPMMVQDSPTGSSAPCSGTQAGDTRGPGSTGSGSSSSATSLSTVVESYRGWMTARATCRYTWWCNNA